MKARPWTQGELSYLREFYETSGGEDVDISAAAAVLGRSYSAVALKASRIDLCRSRDGKGYKRRQESIKASKRANAKRIAGLTAKEKAAISAHLLGVNGFKGHSHTEKLKAAISVRSKAWHQSNPHPKGFLGGRHTAEAKERISVARQGSKYSTEQIRHSQKMKWQKSGTLTPLRAHGSWKADWREIGGKRKFFRSRWEANYARYLEWRKLRGEIVEWEHESEIFWFDKVKRGVVSYLPDFKITLPDGSIEFHEVKGWMDAKSKTKLKRMAKYYPSVTVEVIRGDWFKANRKVLGVICKWEGGRGE